MCYIFSVSFFAYILSLPFSFSLFALHGFCCFCRHFVASAKSNSNPKRISKRKSHEKWDEKTAYTCLFNMLLECERMRRWRETNSLSKSYSTNRQWYGNFYYRQFHTNLVKIHWDSNEACLCLTKNRSIRFKHLKNKCRHQHLICEFYCTFARLKLEKVYFVWRKKRTERFGTKAVIWQKKLC